MATRDSAPRRSDVDSERPKRIPKGALNEHGTRVMVTVECSRCGAVDTLPFKPKSKKGPLCRVCAAEVLGPGWDRGLMSAEEPQMVSCELCAARYWPRHGVETQGLCWDCHSGLERPNHERLVGDVQVVDGGMGVSRLKRRV